MFLKIKSKENKAAVADCGAIPAILAVLKVESSPAVQTNLSAAKSITIHMPGKAKDNIQWT